jgi:hypothetical protein
MNRRRTYHCCSPSRHIALVALVVGLFGGWGSSSVVEAQSVLLHIRPTVGDTLRMKMDQSFEITSDSASASDTFARAVSATVSVYTRSVVLSSSAQGTVLESVTDSVTIIPETARSLPLFTDMEKVLEERKVRLLVAPDGGITIIDGTNSASEVGALGTQIHMPPMLPKEAVSVGSTWTRSMRIPVSAAHSTNGLVRVTFKLDSLGQEGNLAYLSMKGTFTHSHVKEDGKTPFDSTTGTLIGSMQINRRLGWMTESKTTISLNSTVRPSKGASPVRVRMKVTQWLRAISP